MKNYRLNYLDELESESIFVIREAAAQFRNAIILFSGGKDSIVMTHLVEKAFFPGPIPFKLLHIDTGHNFPETVSFRDEFAKNINTELIVRYVQNSIDEGKVVEVPGKSRNTLQSITLLDAIKELSIDAAIGGARRDEEKARAKERFFSHRSIDGGWNPVDQRPELWSLLNGRKKSGEHFRVFPLSNWTEKDIWLYVKKENIQLPSLYFSHNRKVIVKSSELFAYSDLIKIEQSDFIAEKKIRFRTIGDMTCTGAIESSASSIDEIIYEISNDLISERGSRLDDRFSTSAMEERKKKGYF